MASRTKLLLVACAVPFQGLLTWGVLSAMGIEGAGPMARRVALLIAPAGLCLFAGALAWYGLHQRALQRLSPAERDAVNTTLRAGQGPLLAVLLPLIAAANVLGLAVFLMVLLSFLAVSTTWLARKLAQIPVPRDFVRAYVAGQTAVLAGIGIGSSVSIALLQT